MCQVPTSGHFANKIPLFRNYLGTRPLWALGMRVGTGQPWSSSLASLQMCWINAGKSLQDARHDSSSFPKQQTGGGGGPSLWPQGSLACMQDHGDVDWSPGTFSSSPALALTWPAGHPVQPALPTLGHGGW